MSFQTFDFDVNYKPKGTRKLSEQIPYQDGLPAGSQSEGALSETWDVEFTGQAAEVGAIKSFLDAHGGTYPFLWRDPFGVLKKAIVSEYSLSHEEKDVWSISFEFTGVHNA